MTEPLVDIIGGARPNFMKIAPIVRAIHAAQSRGSRLRYRLVRKRSANPVLNRAAIA